MGPVKNYLFRCAVVGYLNAGKTSFIERFINGTFKENGEPVTQLQFLYKEGIKIGNFNIKLEIMDLPGHDHITLFKRLHSRVFVILLFDVSDRNTFHNMDDFIDDMYNNKNINP